jgi:diaminohydroxyphosphoribosylaminopyrimidine deaminase/5-amino-6-(5-phosphoribosylamino)uracil reductase
VAVSADGRTAMADGESKWITGVDARADVQRLRARSCAIVTGAGTVLADDPAMTVRDSACAVDGSIRQPLRVVLDSRLRAPATAQIFRDPVTALWVHAAGAKPQAAAVELLQCGERRVDLAALLVELAQRQCNEVLVEAGPELLGAFIQQGLWDELIVYQAGKLLGSDARPMAQMPIANMADAVGATIHDCERVGEDLRIRLVPDNDQAGSR